MFSLFDSAAASFHNIAIPIWILQQQTYVLKGIG